MTKLVLESGYKIGWYVLPRTAISPKLSIYSLQDPDEQFAELYTIYHNDKGQTIRAKNLSKYADWFEQNVLTDAANSPEAVSGKSEPQPAIQSGKKDKKSKKKSKKDKD